VIRYVGCDYVRPRLDSFVDGELPMGDQVLVETHLRWCHTCAARLEDTQIIGASLRVGARAHQTPDHPSDQLCEQVDEAAGAERPDGVARALAAMQAAVLARVDTEYEQSLGVRVQELFTDMRLWWPALGATVAVALSVGLASGVWRATSAEQPTSLAAMIENLADPGSNRNPQRLDAAMYLPRVLDTGVALDGVMLAQNAGEGQQDEVVAVAAILTREGKIGGYALLEPGGERHTVSAGAGVDAGDVHHVLHAVRQSRFAPAQRPGGQVVAVNMVWLFARTTVKASHSAVDLGMPLTRPVLAVPPPVVKPVTVPAEGASSKDLLQDPRASALDSATA
jgi:hypothetical protein